MSGFSSVELWREIARAGNMLARAEVVLPGASKPTCIDVGWHEPDGSLFSALGGVQDRAKGYVIEYLRADCPDLCEGAEVVIHGVPSVVGLKFKVREEPLVPADGATDGSFRLAPLVELRTT